LDCNTAAPLSPGGGFGSIVALYGMVPLAVSAAVFLPYNKGLRIVINEDGVSLPEGPFLPLWLRPYRLWSDLKSLSVKRPRRPVDESKAIFVLSFHSGGSLRFRASQLSTADLNVLISAIDEHAIECKVSDEAIKICRVLEERDRQKMASDHRIDLGIKETDAAAFKSTVFLPYKPGDYLPDKTTRIVRQLASKPLCAVYLARLESGKLAVVKQFFLSDESDETRAISKIFEREYQLLTTLDHPGISKVVSSYKDGEFTYLIIEHRRGADLRSLVKEHGPRSEAFVV
jgi:hypothetical protein